MKIVLQKKYKSLSGFESDEMPDFCIITGKNGSGKTQLFEAIQKFDRGELYDANSEKIEMQLFPMATDIQFGSIEINNAKPISYDVWDNIIRNFFGDFLHWESEIKDFLEVIIDNGLTFEEAKNRRFDIAKYLERNSKYDNLIVSISNRWGGLGNQKVEDLEMHKKNVTSNIFSKRKTIFEAYKVAKYLNKKMADLELNDFFVAPLSNILDNHSTIFHYGVEQIIYNYARNRFNNELNYFRKNEIAPNTNSIPDHEFVKLTKPPWEFVNLLLSDLNLPYEIPPVAKEMFSINFRFHLQLRHKREHVNINLEDLSSGERIIIGLIFKLYLSASYYAEMRFPDYWFLDEPDAHLHPEMSKLLIQTLYDNFCKKFGIRVIITTHNPSTIAVAPEDCIYQLTNHTSTALKKITKDEALRVLTENIPTLSIDYENHRQVFVESETDQYYYNRLYNKLIIDIKGVHNLYFIANSSGDGNCDQVKKVVTDIRNSGNRTAFGVIDWDLRNENSNHVFVHGSQKRYTIENYLYDPIYLIVLFIEDGLANGIRSLGFDESYNAPNIGEESEEKLQYYIDWFYEELGKKNYQRYLAEELSVVRYYNGKSIKQKRWYMECPGHLLFEKLVKAFPSLQKYQKEKVCQRKMCDLIAKCYPFIPEDTALLVERLSTGRPAVL